MYRQLNNSNSLQESLLPAGGSTLATATPVTQGPTLMNRLTGGRKAQLITAARNGNLKGVIELLGRGADPTAVDARNTTALMHACLNDKVDIVNVLLQALENKNALATVNATNSLGDTALIYASATGSVRIVQILLTAGANVNAVNNNGKTSLMWASQYGRLKTVRELLERGANVNVHEYVPGMLSLIKAWTPLMWACKNGHLEIVRELLDKGANVNAINEAWGSTTPLMWASEISHLEIVKLLCQYGADPNEKNAYGKKAVDYAPSFGNVKDFLLTGCSRRVETGGSNLPPSSVPLLSESQGFQGGRRRRHRTKKRKHRSKRKTRK